jgi:hypothetical protein
LIVTLPHPVTDNKNDDFAEMNFDDDDAARVTNTNIDIQRGLNRSVYESWGERQSVFGGR